MGSRLRDAAEVSGYERRPLHGSNLGGMLAEINVSTEVGVAARSRRLLGALAVGCLCDLAGVPELGQAS
jgi:hypothetical protein